MAKADASNRNGYCSDASDGESDSDDDIPEIRIKRYMMTGGTFKSTLLDNIHQTQAIQSQHMGVKRQIGHYQMRDCTHAVFHPKFESYSGKHWDVEMKDSLRRSTAESTRHAVIKAVRRERRRRLEDEKHFRPRALKTLRPPVRELHDSLTFSERKQTLDEQTAKNHVCQIKDDVQLDMVRKSNATTVDLESKAERKRQLKLVKSMKSEALRTPSVEDLLEGMADTSHRRSLIHQDLHEAFNKLTDEEEDVDQEYQVAMLEMLDESLIKLTMNLALAINRQMSDDEQKRRLVEEHLLDADSIRQLATGDWNIMIGDLMQAFSGIQREEEEEEEQYQQRLSDTKCMILEQLVRKNATKMVEKACAFERARRIQDEDADMERRDAAKDGIKHLMARVQRQMILQKFKGKWINLTFNKKVVEEEAKEKDRDLDDKESQRDRKLRKARLRSRRQSCVVRGDDD